MSKWYKPSTWINKAEDVAKNIGKTVVAPFEGLFHAGEAGVHLLEGDLKGASKSIAKSVGDISYAGVSSITAGLTPGVAEFSKNIASAGTSYVSGNFNRGSEYLEKATGWDIDNSIAEAQEAQAQAEYQKQVNEANEISQRNLRANLLSLRKNLQKTYTKSTQGGGAGLISNNNTATGGVILG